jgi:hypothetical protein
MEQYMKYKAGLVEALLTEPRGNICRQISARCVPSGNGK